MDCTVAIYVKLQPGVETEKIRIERKESNNLEWEEADTKIESKDANEMYVEE